MHWETQAIVQETQKNLELLQKHDTVPKDQLLKRVVETLDNDI